MAYSQDHEIEVQEMHVKTSLLVALCASLLLPACTSTNVNRNSGMAAQVEGAHTQGDSSVYMQRGMEMSTIASRMADTLQQNMFYYLLPDAPIDRSSANGNVKIVTMPRLALTAFVDTDTYEDSGYLGRALAEMFTHEMSSRAFEVTEYKLTGKLAVSKDGDYIFSRDWKKIASDTHVKYLLGGTMTRNKDGVVVVARIVNMQTRQTVATATDIIPYSLLPNCYRTAQKNCAFTGTKNYLSPDLIRIYQGQLASGNANTRTSALQVHGVERQSTANTLTKAQVRSASGQPLGGVFLAYSDPNSASTITTVTEPDGRVITTTTTYSGTAAAAMGQPSNNAYMSDADRIEQMRQSDPRFTKDVVVGATSRGTYDKYRMEKSGSAAATWIDSFGDDVDPVVYPASSYVHNTMLVRDTADESNYQRYSE